MRRDRFRNDKKALQGGRPFFVAEKTAARSNGNPFAGHSREELCGERGAVSLARRACSW